MINNAVPGSSDASAISWRLKDWFPELEKSTHDQLRLYFDELVKFNKVVNLVSPKSISNADAVHFADSLLASRIVRRKVNKNELLYDIGSGNGFPGLVYAILFLDQKVALLDVDERKCEFLRHIIKSLGLKNVEVQTKRVESMANDSITQGLCRGFAPLPRALLTLRKIVKQNGVLYHLKSDEWGIEVSQIPIQLCSHWQPTLESEYQLPTVDTKFFVIRTDKISSS